MMEMMHGHEAETETRLLTVPGPSASRTQGRSVDVRGRCDTAAHIDLDWAVNEQWEDSLGEKEKKITKLHIQTVPLC